MGLVSRVLPFLWGLLSANIALLVFCTWVQNDAPAQDVRITSRADGVLLYGRNSFGIMSVKAFRNWDETQSYLERKNLHLPELSYAELGGTDRISFEAHGPSYKVKWVSQGLAKVLYAPDESTARAFASYIRFRDLAPSYLGFSLSVTN